MLASVKCCKRKFTKGDFTSEKKDNVQMGLRISRGIAERFKTICREERRNLNDQFEVIFEDWLANHGKDPPIIIHTGTGQDAEKSIEGVSSSTKRIPHESGGTRKKK